MSEYIVLTLTGIKKVTNIYIRNMLAFDLFHYLITICNMQKINIASYYVTT